MYCNVLFGVIKATNRTLEWTRRTLFLFTKCIMVNGKLWNIRTMLDYDSNDFYEIKHRNLIDRNLVLFFLLKI